jgi:gliding motility-associated-like protein
VGEGYCLSVDSAIISVAPAVGYSMVVSDTSLCFGEFTSINVNAYGGNGNQITYSWSNGLPPLQQHIISPSESTDYSLVISDGCSVIHDTARITVAPEISYTLDFSAAGCYGTDGFAVYSGNPGTLITWDGSEYSSGTELPGLSSYIYNAIVTDTTSGCSVDTLVTILGYPIVLAEFSINPDLDCIPAGIRNINFLDLSRGGVTGTWSFGEGADQPWLSGENPFHEYNSHGTFQITLEVSDSNGCSDKYQREICLEEPFKVYLPSAFTVNADALNDVFKAKGTGILEFHMWIYNRNNTLIFESNDINNGWDGLYDGNLVQQGVYGWIVEVQWTNKQWFTTAGSVSLIR